MNLPKSIRKELEMAMFKTQDADKLWTAMYKIQELLAMEPQTVEEYMKKLYEELC